MTAPLYAPAWLRGITIKQPWAASIVHGDKRIENRPRPWPTGWYLLHAGAVIDRPALRDPLVARTVHGHHLHTRAVLAVARITDCHAHTGTDSGDASCGRWAQPGCFHLDLDDVHALPLPVSLSRSARAMARSAAGLRAGPAATPPSDRAVPGCHLMTRPGIHLAAS